MATGSAPMHQNETRDDIRAGAPDKPNRSFAELWNISFGFLGIQIAFGLQNGNVSRIFQTLGADVEALPLLWIAGPVTGLLVQPLIGHYSDRTWGKFGRRRPYFFAGALLAALALFGFPHAHALFAAAIFLWVLDASLNISMEPFRAFVGDMVNRKQRPAGYAFQTAFIGAGAVIGSLAPYVLTKLGVANTAPEGVIPDAVKYSFYIGAVAIFLAVLWTVLTTKEYSPQELRAFDGEPEARHEPPPLVAPSHGIIWTLVGVAFFALVYYLALDKQLYILGGGLALFGVAQIINRMMVQDGARDGNVLSHILSDLAQMPTQMKRLAVAQFFSWFALFIMWINTTPVVTQYIYNTTDTTSQAYGTGADWVGVLFAIYNGVAAIAAFTLPVLARNIGASKTHMVGLLVGALGFLGLFLIRDANMLVLPMIGIGIAWASILTMPYVILSNTLPQDKLGIYMGIFNFFVVLPQLLVATVMGGIMKSFFPGQPIWTMLIGAVVLVAGAVSMLWVREDSAG